LYREGFARLSSTRFSLDSIADTCNNYTAIIHLNSFHKKIDFVLVNLDVHITNNAIQKNSPNYDPDKGAKWSVQNLRQYLIAKHGLEEVI